MGHGGSGKTSFAEAMLYNTGVLDRLGKVVDGNTVMDYDGEEIKRKISINTALAACEWKDVKINIIDTPGYFDFVGEVKQGIKVSEGCIIIVSAKSGPGVGTEKAWEYAEEQKNARFFYINKMDEENANFTEALNKMKELFGKSIIALQVPIMENEKFVGYIDIVSMSAYKFENGKPVNCAIPDFMNDIVSEYRDTLIEAVAETDDELMEKYFDGKEFTPEEIEKGLKIGIKDASIAPVFCGSSINNINVTSIMDAIVRFMPSPLECPVTKASDPSGGAVDIKMSNDEKFSALVFKTIADPFVGKINLFKVYSGTLKADMSIYNPRADKVEKISQIFTLRGKKQLPVDKLQSGDIGAIAKLQSAATNDTLCDQSRPVIIPQITFPEPVISMAVEPLSKGDEEKISAGLHKLQDEDPTFTVSVNSETRQTIISGMGEQHLDVMVSKLKSKYNVSVNITVPKVPYRETIRKKVKSEGKHKKQSGGHGQYGHVWIEFEPGDTEDLIFEEKIFGGAVPKQYFPAVEKGLRESIRKGVLANYPVVNLKATLVDGSFHPVDSSEMAFKVAASLAYKNGLPKADPVLLEPILHVEVYVPEKYMGDIIGDLNKRRGRILGMNPQDKGIQQVVAEVPQAEMFKYATDLRSMTQGRGYFKLWFERYEEAPPMVSQKVIDEAKKHMDDEGNDN